MKNNKSLLIAGCGDIGAHLAGILGEFDVYGLRRSKGCRVKSIGWIQADLTQPATLAQLPAVDYLIYTATPAQRTETAYREIYYQGLKNIIGAMKIKGALESKVLRRAFMVSSTSVYGQNNGVWVNEESPTYPRSFSGQVLREAESWLLAQQLPATLVRFSGIYGPGREHLIRKVKSGRFTSQQAPPKYTNRIHRDDCAGVLTHLIKLDQSNVPLKTCYLGSDSDPVTEWEIHQWLAKVMKVPPPSPTQVEAGAKPKQNKRCSNSRLLQSGYQFKYPNFRLGYAACLRSKE